MMKKIVFMALACAALTSCGGGARTALTGTEWKLVELYGEQSPAFADEDAFWFMLDAAEPQINGVGACNRFFGSYELEGSDGIDIENVGMTRMMCPDIEWESRFMEALDETDRYTVAGDQLTLYDEGLKIAVLKRAPGLSSREAVEIESDAATTGAGEI